MSFFFLSFIFALGFVVIHFSTKYMMFLEGVPRSRFLSLSGGIAVAYVFVHLLPELNHHDPVIEESVSHFELSFLEHHAYLVALLGLAFFYGMEKMVKDSKNNNDNSTSDMPASDVFWIHILSFFVYNAVIGYLLIREHYENFWDLFFFFLALAVHFIINDHALRQNHKSTYDRYGRWLLSGSILLGWGIGAATVVNELVISLLVAFIAGGIILNVLKEELPEERESSFIAFFIGLIGYAFLLLL
ncbi:hypothetical protein [Sutcliffiella deserti]|uniref:hypothetical protein n=1 Tax=Sutcliffiella deserti TaxID=2875501 RepID=UPI001CC13086|nr:hypothetical protein [Sutcliffiella deserti]